MSDKSGGGNLVGRHVVRIILNGSPPPPPADGANKPKKKFSQSTSSLVVRKSSKLDRCTSSLLATQPPSSRENELELALREVRKEKAEVEEEQGRLLAFNAELALENKRLLEEQPRLKLEMKRLEEENALWKVQEADMVRANAELVFEVERLYLKEERWRGEAVCLKKDLDQMKLTLKECKPGGDIDLDQGLDQVKDHDHDLGQGQGYDQCPYHDQGPKRGENVETELKEDEEEEDVKCRTEEKDSSYKTLKMVKLAPKFKLEEGKVEVDEPIGLENLLIDFD